MQFRLSTIALLFSSMFFLKSSLLRLLIDFFPVAVIASAGPIPSADNVELRDVIVSLSFINAKYTRTCELIACRRSTKLAHAPLSAIEPKVPRQTDKYLPLFLLGHLLRLLSHLLNSQIRYLTCYSDILFVFYHIRPATIYHTFYSHNLLRLLSHSLNSQIRHFRPTIIYHLSHYFSISKDPWHNILYHFASWNLFLAHRIHLYHYQLR